MGSAYQPDVSLYNSDSHFGLAIIATLANMNDIDGSSLIPYLCLIFTGCRQLTHDFFLFLCFFSYFFLVIILLSFRVQLFLLGQLALELSCERELSEACAQVKRPTSLINLVNYATKNFNSMTNNIINCKYMDIHDKTLNLQNGSNFMILMHFNIRSLQKKLR